MSRNISENPNSRHIFLSFFSKSEGTFSVQLTVQSYVNQIHRTPKPDIDVRNYQINAGKETIDASNKVKTEHGQPRNLAPTLILPSIHYKLLVLISTAEILGQLSTRNSRFIQDFCGHPVIPLVRDLSMATGSVHTRN